MTLRSQSRQEAARPTPSPSPETRTDLVDEGNVPRTTVQNIGASNNTRRRCDSCGSMFKNERGVKIHQGKSTRCRETQLQRTPKSKTSEDLSQDSHHRAPDPCATDIPTPPGALKPLRRKTRDDSRRMKIDWPSSADKRWRELDDDLNTILESRLKGPVVDKIDQMTSIVYEVCLERFGLMTQPNLGNPQPHGPSRRQL